MNVCLGMCIYYVCMCILCIWVYSVCMHVCTCIYVVCVCMRMYVHVSSCVWLRDTAFQINSYDPNSITENLDCVRYKPDTQAIRRPTHGMIRRSVPARTVKTKWRFRSKPRHFMWVFALVSFSYLLLPVGVNVFIRIISCDRLIYFASMIIYIISWDISERPL